MRFFPALISALAVATATAALIWSVNWSLAKYPAQESFKLEQRAATALIGNHPIVFPSRINESVLRWCLAEQLQTTPELVLFGSSHGLQVSSDEFGQHRLLNLSISGAMLTDHLISTEILVRREKRPRVWVVMVDAWLFNLDVDFQTWHARPTELTRIEATLSHLAEPPLTPVFTPRIDYFLSTKRKPEYSLDPLFREFDRFTRKHFDDVVVPEHDSQATTMLPDGSLQPSSDKQQISPEAVQALALRQFSYSGDRHRYGSYAKIDEGLWRLFEIWVQYLQQDGGRVVFVFSPYHPAIYDRITKQPHNQLRTLEGRIRESAHRGNIPVIGSYDPTVVGVSNQDFYDGDHLRESGLHTLFNPGLPETTRGL